MPAAGVFKKEVDLSLFVEIASELRLGVVGAFNKGPINDRTLITNPSFLEETFGKPIDDDVLGQPFFGTREFLRNANQAYVVRVESATNPAVVAKTALRGTSEDSLATNTDGATSIPATRELTSAGSSFVTAGVLVGDILEIHEGGADDGFYVITVVAATTLTVDRDWPTGSLSSLDFTVWSSKREAGTDGATGAQAGRTFTSAGSTFLLNGVAAGDILHIDDTGDTDDNGFYVIESVTSETTLVVNRQWRVGDLTGLTFTIYGPNHPAAADGDTTVDGEFTSATAQFQLHGVAAGDILLIEDTSDPGNNGAYVIEGLKSGSEATTLEVNIGSWPASLSALEFRVVPGFVVLEGLTKGTWLNDYTARAGVNSSNGLQFDLQVIDNNGFVVETVFTLDGSNIEDELTDNSSFLSATVSTALRDGPGLTGTTLFNGGEDGTTGLSDADIIGNSNLKTGLQAFSNIEEVEIDVLMVPGYHSQNIGDALILMAETTRGDCMAIVDPPDFPTVGSVQDVLDWHNGVGGFGRTSALNSSHAALYWSWLKIFDPFHNKDRWTAPSGHASSVWAQSDNQTYLWFAPAGTRRGLVRGASDVRLSPDAGQRTAMQVGANVNPIVKFIQEGIAIFGQKTLLRTSSALNRVNVRRMLLFLERASLNAVKPLVFDPNDVATDREIVRLLNPLFEFVRDNRGLREFLVVPSSTDAIRAQNKNVTKIFVKPTTTAELIELQFILTPQSANFEELLTA